MDEVEVPRFTVVFRGYDRHQVDSYISSLLLGDMPTPDEDLSGIDAELDAFFRNAPPTEFDVVFRGYDRKEVDRFVAEQERRLRDEKNPFSPHMRMPHP